MATLEEILAARRVAEKAIDDAMTEFFRSTGLRGDNVSINWTQVTTVPIGSPPPAFNPPPWHLWSAVVMLKL